MNVSNDGPLTKSITIRSNDPQAATKYLMLQADISRSIGLFPKFMSFNNMEVGKEASAVVIVKNSTSKAVKISALKVSPEDMHVTIKDDDEIPANGQITIKATYNPQKPGNLSGKIAFKTSDEEVPNVEITAYGNVLLPPPPADAKPNDLKNQNSTQVGTAVNVSPATVGSSATFMLNSGNSPKKK